MKNPEQLAKEREPVLDLVRKTCPTSQLQLVIDFIDKELDKKLAEGIDVDKDPYLHSVDLASMTLIRLKHLLRDGYTMDEGDSWAENHDMPGRW